MSGACSYADIVNRSQYPKEKPDRKGKEPSLMTIEVLMNGLLIIVPCGFAKVWDTYPERGPTPAREAYTGAFFKTNRAYAECFSARWVILSAKYGFIPPDFRIPAPYNVTFKEPATWPVEVAKLIDQVRDQRLDGHPRIIGLGGKEYRRAIEQAFDRFRREVEFPFAGLPIGQAIQATKRAIGSGNPAPGQSQSEGLKMYVRFPESSTFADPLFEGIKEERTRLDSGSPIEVLLHPGGYLGKSTVMIRADDRDGFEVEGSMRDPSRFPQRIKVAAWALHQEGAFGRFVIEHDRQSGTVIIQKFR